ncbi:MAG TPA: CoA transferase [Acidimicrobiales bacterium]|nr:CoA transferase [Acidimicrobiales bacterium]
MTTSAPLAGIRVVELASFVAAPAAGALLADLGAEVIKVEVPWGEIYRHSFPRYAGFDSDFALAPHFHMDNRGKRSVALDLRSADGRRDLARLLRIADVVVSSSRPRAFEALGVDVGAVLTASPTVWVAITAHGWDGPGRDRVGFGDDAAVAGGLVAPGPRFASDAIADPLTGVLAAHAARAALTRGGSWLIDAPLARAAAYAQSLAGPPDAAPDASPPRARRPPAPARPLGADTAAVLAALP